MYPEQKDYGTGSSDESTLVPGSLIVFRHFQADIRSGVLMPMNYNPKRAAVGWPGRPGYRAYQPSGVTWPDGKISPEIYVAECNKGPTMMYQKEHKSPSKTCTCGFYASYDPREDFYPSFRWGRAYADYAGYEDVRDMVIVKAAVEMTGTVVMGRLGVRAEKMKILGIAIDWSKHMKRSASEWDMYGAARRDAGYRSIYYDHMYEEYRYGLHDDRYEVDEKAEAEAGVDVIAFRYGVAKYFERTEDLADAYPKADLEALGVDTTPPAPVHDLDGFYFVQPGGAPQPMKLSAQQADLLAKQMNMYAAGMAKSMSAAVQGASAALSIFDEAFTQNAKPKQKEQRKQPKVRTGNPVFVEALEAKRNRPAPPGAGIDRRRGRLR